MDKATHYLLFIPKTGTTVLYLLVFTIYHFCKSFAKNITGAISKRPTTTDPADQSIAGQYIDVSPKLISQSTNNTETPIATEDYLNLHLYGPPNGTNIFHVAMFLKCIAALNTTHTIIGNAIENIAMGLIGSLNYNQAHLTTLATNRNYIITTEWQGLAELLFDTLTLTFTQLNSLMATKASQTTSLCHASAEHTRNTLCPSDSPVRERPCTARTHQAQTQHTHKTSSVTCTIATKSSY